MQNSPNQITKEQAIKIAKVHLGYPLDAAEDFISVEEGSSEEGPPCHGYGVIKPNPPTEHCWIMTMRPWGMGNVDMLDGPSCTVWVDKNTGNIVRVDDSSGG